MSFSMPCEGSEIDSHEIAFDESEKETPASREDHTGEDGVTTMEGDPVCRNGLVPLVSFDEPVIVLENKDVSAKDDVFQQVMASWGSSFKEELDREQERATYKSSTLVTQCLFVILFPSFAFPALCSSYCCTEIQAHKQHHTQSP